MARTRYLLTIADGATKKYVVEDDAVSRPPPIHVREKDGNPANGFWYASQINIGDMICLCSGETCEAGVEVTDVSSEVI